MRRSPPSYFATRIAVCRAFPPVSAAGRLRHVALRQHLNKTGIFSGRCRSHSSGDNTLGETQSTLSAHNWSEALIIPERDGNAIAKRVQEIVLSVTILVTDTKTFDLFGEVVSGLSLVDRRFIEGMLGIFNIAAVYITRSGECALILA
jgi:hypothetical protein